MRGDLDGELSSFIGESEELIASLYETLGRIEPGGSPRQGDINALFRATHTLKGLAGMLDFMNLQTVAHHMEDLLGGVRLGKVAWSDQVSEVVAQGVDHIRAMLDGIAAGTGDGHDVAGYVAVVERAQEAPGALSATLTVDVPEEIRQTFTEYEESRLLHSVRSGMTIVEIVFRVKLSEFAKVGQEIAEVLEASGEIITKLPAPGGAGGELLFIYLVAVTDPGFEEALPELFGERVVSHRAVAAALGAGSPSPAVAPPAEALDDVAMDAGAEAEGPALGKAASATVRIELQTLESLTAVVGGLLVEKAQLEDVARRYRERFGDAPPYPDLVRTIREMEKRVLELQRSLMTVRLVPIAQMWSRLRRIVQGYTRASGKRIGLVLEGGDTRLDKVIVEKLADPLVHIIRNAIDHGIEPLSERVTLGKEPQGTVVLSAAPRGSQIVVSVKDDGRGIDWDVVARKATERGLLRDPENATERDLLEALFHPGFSTAEKVTDLSGRGVGLDVVRRNLSEVNGLLEVRSVRHEGTEFLITLPITLAIFQSLLVDVEGRTFAIPLAAVLENLRLPASAIQTLEGRAVIQHRGAEIPVTDLGEALRLRSRDRSDDGGNRYLVVVGSAEKRLALRVDAVRGQREIVTKSLGKLLSGVPGMAGGALVGEQQMALVLDVNALVAEREP